MYGLIARFPLRVSRSAHYYEPVALEAHVALESTEVRGQITDNYGEVSVRQTYVNQFDAARFLGAGCSCRYVFPLDEEAAVFEFAAEMDGRVVKGLVKPREQARTEFRDAVRRGRTAALLEEKAANVFECDLGNLPPGARCTITLKYLTCLDLEQQDGATSRFVLPMHLAPRYVPRAAAAHPQALLPSSGASPLAPTAVGVHPDVQCDGCLQQPIRGPRFRCAQGCGGAAGFDLCGACQAQGVHAHSGHAMREISASAEAPELHRSVTCDGCGVSPIRGGRWKCRECDDFDLCDSCYGASARKSGGLGHAPAPAARSSRPDADASAAYAAHGFDRVLGASASWSEQSVLRELEMAACSITVAAAQRVTLDLRFLMSSPIESFRQGNDRLPYVRLEAAGAAGLHVRFDAHQATHLAADLVVLIKQRGANAPRLLAEYSAASDTTALQLAFAPPPLDALSSLDLACEFVLLVDRSGSMDGESMRAAAAALSVQVHSLPANARFNIVGFGSTHRKLWPKSQAVSPETLEQADAHIARLKADLGGTEILRPLQEVLTDALLDTHPRQVFLYTDGDVENSQQVVRLAAAHCATTRIFTIGIGAHADRHLCKSVARAANGHCAFVDLSSAGDPLQKRALERAVEEQMQRALQPMFTEVQLEWGASAQVLPLALQTPCVPAAMYPNAQTRFYAVSAPGVRPEQLLAAGGAGAGVCVRYKCNRPGSARGAQELRVALRPECVVAAPPGDAGAVHRLAARAAIRELEALPSPSAEVERRICDLATRHQLTSSQTSFVLVFESHAQPVRDPTGPAVPQHQDWRTRAGLVRALNACVVEQGSASGARLHARSVGTINSSAPTKGHKPPSGQAGVGSFMSRLFSSKSRGGTLQCEEQGNASEEECSGSFSLFGNSDDDYEEDDDQGLVPKFKKKSKAVEEDSHTGATKKKSAAAAAPVHMSLEEAFHAIVRAQQMDGSFVPGAELLRALQAVCRACPPFKTELDRAIALGSGEAFSKLVWLAFEEVFADDQLWPARVIRLKLQRYLQTCE